MSNGAKYYRCDFQVHSPKDLQFSGKEYILEADRKQYAKDFIRACRAKKVDAVAITDHHDLTFFKYIKEASIEEVDGSGQKIKPQDRVVVFPGLELTLDVPCQALLLFDSDFEMTDENRIKIYTALNIQVYTKAEDSKTSEVVRLPFKSINEVYDALNTVNEFRGRFIVFPNVKDGGNSSILRTGFHNEYANGVFVGGYLDRGLYDSHKTKIGWSNIINGEVDAYGNKSIGIIQTSDNRTDSFEHLGISSSWIKWSVATAEGLRQACLAKQSRILQEEPLLPTTWLSYIKITGSSFLKDMEVSLNPQFNCLIGGRGTGKSSLLQFISWALGKDANFEKGEELNRFIEGTLESGEVEITILKNGIAHQIRRSPTSYEIKIGNEQWQHTNSQNINSIIITDSFSQKELSKHEKDRTSQLEQIIENAVSSELESLSRRAEENGNKIKEASSSYETYLSNVKSSENLKTQIESIEEQIKALNEQLTAIPSEDQIIIKNNTQIDNEKSLLRRSGEQINSISNAISEILNKGNFSKLSYKEEDVLNKEGVKTFSTAHDEIIENLQGELRAILEKNSSENLARSSKSLVDLHGEHDKQYLEAKARQNNFEQIIKALEELRRKLSVLNTDRSRLLDQITKDKGLPRVLQKLFKERITVNKEVHALLKGAISEIQSQSEGSLEIEVSELENIDHIVNRFIEQVTSSKGQPERTKAFFDGMKEGEDTYKNLLKFWRVLYKSLTNNLAIENVIEDYRLENPTLLETDFERIVKSFNIGSIIDFALRLPTYKLKLLYCKDAQTKIPFEDASYGQQAGSILTILLNQEFGPLLIDQPEDDLDNKVIHRITQNIVTAKHKRQLIFSSHNANIVVNGDAELILTFDHNADKSAGEIVCLGSIDKDEIKEHIKEVMEGGKKAFEMRKVKYGF